MTRLLPTIRPATISRISAQRETISDRSIDMPMTMKNRPTRIPRKGRISASTWCRYSVSASSSPAMKAPSAIEKPPSETAQLVPSTTNNVVATNSSALPDAATTR